MDLQQPVWILTNMIVPIIYPTATHQDMNGLQMYAGNHVENVVMTRKLTTSCVQYGYAFQISMMITKV